MRKTLFSVLPLLVFLGPSYAGLPSFLGLFSGPPATRVEANYLRKPSAHPAAVALRGRIGEAKRELKRLPADSLDDVTLAVADRSGDVQTLRASKEEFLRQGGEFTAVTPAGETLKVSIVRPNYVNTAVRVTDAEGRELQPLVVRDPVEREGKLHEVAYYTSAHPAVENREVVRAGGEYVRERLDEAARRLAAIGERIDPAVIDVAERLCHVEHTDHKRFLTEDSASLFDEIRTLYALNAGDTYRYSVSSAGAGGMVQMIPPTYQGVREQHPKAGLKADFVVGCATTRTRRRRCCSTCRTLGTTCAGRRRSRRRSKGAWRRRPNCWRPATTRTRCGSRSTSRAAARPGARSSPRRPRCTSASTRQSRATWTSTAARSFGFRINHRDTEARLIRISRASVSLWLNFLPPNSIWR